MTGSDWKSDFGPFESNADKYHFWRFVLKKVEHLDDYETLDKIHFAFVDWRRRQEDVKGALTDLEQQERLKQRAAEAKASQEIPPEADRGALRQDSI